MDAKKLLTADYLDIIYDNRNKDYGGYELRTHYNRRLRKAMALALTGVAALLSFSFITINHADKNHVISLAKPVVITEIHPPVQPPIHPKTEPPKPPTAAAQPVKTKLFVAPIIAPDDKPDKPMPDKPALTGAQPGATNHDGDSSLSGDGMGKTPGNSIVTTIGNDKPKTPVRWVEQMPRFNGDMAAYLSSNINYPEAARSSGISGRVVVEFVVNEDGSVSNAHIVRGIGGGCDQEALRVVSAMPHWKAGKQNGTPVKVYFTLPINFELN